jgi:hypothetical protein
MTSASRRVGHALPDIEALFEDVLPPPGLLAMLKVYMDMGEKTDENDGVLTVASVIYQREKYKRFRREWNAMLKPWGASAFHATDFYPGGGEFKRDTDERKQLFRDDSKRIPKMVGKYARRITFVSFRPEEFKQVAPPDWKKHFGTSFHSQAVQLLLISNGWWRYEVYPRKSFAYFMESGDKDEGQIVNTIELMRQDRINGTGHVIAVSSFSTVDKGKLSARGLEAADFVAWHWNKHYMDKIREGQNDKPRKDFEAFLHAAGTVNHIFATGERLKYIFSLVPAEVLKGKNEKRKTIRDVRSGDENNAQSRSEGSEISDGSGEASEREKAEG